MRALKSALAMAAMFAVAGCVSVLPEQAVPNALYRLAPVTPSGDLAENIVVREPTSARVFSGQGMVAQREDGGLRLIAEAEWAGRLTKLLQTGLVDALSGPGEGIAVTELSGAPGSLELVWRVQDMTLVGATAVCHLDITMLDGRTREPLFRNSVLVREEVRGSSTPARAQALSRVAAVCVEEAARLVSDAVQGRGDR